jgi:iron uptake system component EfeO
VIDRRTPAPVLVALVLVALVLAGCAAGPGGAAGSAKPTRSSMLVFKLTDGGCVPSSVSVPAGPTTFSVHNDDARTVTELEVLRDGRIIGEAEDVVPGIVDTFSLTLDAGSYDLRCAGGTTHEVGTLTVTGSGPAVSPAPAGQRAVASYRTYVERQTDELVARVRAFTAAVLDGRQARARSLFAWAREPYERVEPVAEAFGDLDPRIDARDNDVPPATWGGFHRIEKALWVDRSLAGTAYVARNLRADVGKLDALVDTVRLEPAQIANGATELLDEVSTSKVTGEEDRYSHTDLSDFRANVDGSSAAFASVRPLLEERNAALAAQIAHRFAAVDRALDAYRRGGGFVSYRQLTSSDTRTLSQAIDALAEPLSQVAGTLVGP